MTLVELHEPAEARLAGHLWEYRFPVAPTVENPRPPAPARPIHLASCPCWRGVPAVRVTTRSGWLSFRRTPFGWLA